MRADAEALAGSRSGRYQATPLVDPVAVPLVRLVRRDEELHLHLLELERAEDEVARRDLVAERLADLRDPERRLAARELGDVLEVDEDPLRRLGAEVDALPRLLDGPDARLEHEVELARLGEVAVGGLARALAGLSAALLVVEVVGAEALLAGPAVDERVGEASDVARGLPDLGCRMIAESSATMSSRSCTIASSQRALTFSLRSTP